MTLTQTQISALAPRQRVLYLISFRSQLMIQADLNEPYCGLPGGTQCFSTNDACGLSLNPVKRQKQWRRGDTCELYGWGPGEVQHHILPYEERASFLGVETVLNFWNHCFPNTAQPRFSSPSPPPIHPPCLLYFKANPQRHSLKVKIILAIKWHTRLSGSVWVSPRWAFFCGRVHHGDHFWEFLYIKIKKNLSLKMVFSIWYDFEERTE